MIKIMREKRDGKRVKRKAKIEKNGESRRM